MGMQSHKHPLSSTLTRTPRSRVEAFYRAMEIQVLPELDALGLGAPMPGGAGTLRDRHDMNEGQRSPNPVLPAVLPFLDAGRLLL